MIGGIPPPRHALPALNKICEGWEPLDPVFLGKVLGHGLESANSPFNILSQAGGGGDIVSEILKHIPIIIPDHARTLGEAIRMCPSGGTILIKGGQHTVGARPGEVSKKYNEGGTDSSLPPFASFRLPVSLLACWLPRLTSLIAILSCS